MSNILVNIFLFRKKILHLLYLKGYFGRYIVRKFISRNPDVLTSTALQMR